MAFISAVVWGIGKAGLDLDTEVLAGVVSPLWAYIFAQGVADHGKSKAEITAGLVNEPAMGAPTMGAPAEADPS